MRRALAAVAAAGLWCAPVAAEAAGRSPQQAQPISAPLEPHPLLAEAARHLGQGNFTGMPGAWCAWFVSFVLKATGHRPLPSGMASSALAYGPHLREPRAGALVVMRGHVGLVEAVNADGSISMISGNWSHRVARARIARREVVAFVGV
jgi:uncharacterized protein (TIGR02594 family)